MSVKQTGSFAERVDFPAIYDGLDKEGIRFSDEEKKQFEKYTKQALHERDPANMIGTNPGADFQSLVTFVLALFKNMFGGDKGIGDALSGFGDSYEQAANQTNFIKFNYALQDLHAKLAHSNNPNFQRAADLVTGQHEGRGLPKNMQASIFNQLKGDINVPEGTSVSLDSHEMNGDLAAPPHRVARARTRALT